MPGIYAKPPTRADFAKEIEYMLLVLKQSEKQKRWREIMETCVPMILDEFAMERQKAREEARKCFDEIGTKQCETSCQYLSNSLDDSTADIGEGSATQRDSSNSNCQPAGVPDRKHGTKYGAPDPPTCAEQNRRRAPSLTELEARKQKDVAEVFFVCGVHTAFCRLLEMSKKEPEIGDVMPIIMEYERMMLVEIDPYDIDINPIPLLVYFLAERHHFYVDIHWQHHELTIMETFLRALIGAIEPSSSDLAEACVDGMYSPTDSKRRSRDSRPNTLSCAKELVPQDREPVSAPAASSTSFPEQSEMPSAEQADDGKQGSRTTSKIPAGSSILPPKEKQIRVQCSGTSTGQSNELKAAIIKLLCRTLFIFPPHRVVSRMATVFDATRCRTLTRALLSTSPFWECSKGLAQIAHTLAAITLFGLGAPMAAAVVPASLLWVGASNLIRETRCPCSSCELQRRLLKACRMRDEVGVPEAAQDKRQVAYSLVRAGAPRLLQRLLSCLARQQIAVLDETSDISLDTVAGDHISYIDQAMQFSSWVLLLCSWPYEELHARECFLAFNNSMLLDSILACLPTTQRAFLTTLTTHQRPGAASLLSATLHLLLRTPLTLRYDLLLKANAVFYPLAFHIAMFVTARDPYGRIASDLDHVASDKVENAHNTSTVTAVPGDEQVESSSSVQKWEKQITTSSAGLRVTESPRVGILLLAPLFMSLLQSLLCIESELVLISTSGALSGAATPTIQTKPKNTPTNACTATADASGSAVNNSLTHLAALAHSDVSAMTAAQRPAAPARHTELSVAPMARPVEEISSQFSEPQNPKGKIDEDVERKRSLECAAGHQVTETSKKASASLAAEQRRRILSLGTAACQAFVHIYEYLQPLLAQWEGFESRQAFEYPQSKHISDFFEQKSASENNPLDETSTSSIDGQKYQEKTCKRSAGDDSDIMSKRTGETTAAARVEDERRLASATTPSSAVRLITENSLTALASDLELNSAARVSAEAASVSSSIVVSACSTAVQTVIPSLTPQNKAFLPSRIFLAPCLNTSATGFDYRGFYCAVVSCMLTLVGGMNLHALPENRWRFAENPAAGAGGTAAIGGLASAARKVMDIQKRELTQVCSYVKNAANLVVMRAEQASAILLRQHTIPSRKLCFLSVKTGEATSKTSYPETASVSYAASIHLVADEHETLRSNLTI